MKAFKTIFLFALLAPVLAFRGNQQESGKYQFLPGESTITWKVISDGNEGVIGLMRGNMDIDYGRLNAFELRLDLDKLTVTIPDNEKKQEKIIEELRKEKNFYAEVHPDITFKLTKASQKPDADGWQMFDVKGRLIIKGIYEDVSFPLKVKVEGKKVQAQGQFTAGAARWEMKDDVYFSFDLHGTK